MSPNEATQISSSNKQTEKEKKKYEHNESCNYFDV